jgi:TorA maturation chaperone TorD
MIGDRDLLAFRQEYYRLFVSLFSKEPSADQLEALSIGITERIEAARNLNPLLAQGWEEIHRFLTAAPSEQLAESVEDEYIRLFVGPHTLEVNPYESFYFTGRLMDRPLADVRGFLKSVGIEKRKGYVEPDDFLAFELEVMRWLTGKQSECQDPATEKVWLDRQAQFLKQHLLIWGPACAQDIENAKGAAFYRAAGMTLRGFLDMEQTLFSEWSPGKIASLDEIRKLYGALPKWKGPTVDFSAPNDKPGEK